LSHVNKSFADDDPFRALEIAYYAFAAIAFALVPYTGFYLFAETFSVLQQADDVGQDWQMIKTISYLSITLLALSCSLLFFATARALKKRTKISMIRFTSFVILLLPPFGTLVGIFTFKLLRDPNVHRQFECY
jgi:TRAP-type C4-dicarboxylate transport system permease small subunit